MELEELFNYGEAGLWFAVAVVIFVKSRRAAPAQMKLAVITALAFVAFGVSDLIEAQTGAWWTPWWLFVLKAACVAVFVLAWCKYRRLARGKSTPDR